MAIKPTDPGLITACTPIVTLLNVIRNAHRRLKFNRVECHLNYQKSNWSGQKMSAFYK